MSDSMERIPSYNQPDFYAPLAGALPIAEQVQGLVLRRARTGVLQALKAAGARTVLDVCCGSGCLSCRLARAGFEVTGVDASAAMLNRARTKQRAARFLLGDASRMPFTGAFDAAVVSLALHEMDGALRESVWEAMRRAVKPGGLLVALDFTAPKSPAWHTRIMGKLIDSDEKQIGAINPAHYNNFREFMGTGGLEAWLDARGQTRLSGRYYAGGNIGVFAVAG
jgi:ubiquinone/menaquinone biosynthesis C-methylase UbiE